MAGSNRGIGIAERRGNNQRREVRTRVQEGPVTPFRCAVAPCARPEKPGGTLMQSGAPALDSHEIEKQFGYVFAVRNFTLQIRRGEFVTLFGRNGAGKTTFLKIAATLIRPTRGTLVIEGYDVQKQPEEARRCIGFLSHNTFVYRDLSALDNLKFFCRLYSVDDSEGRILALLDRVGLRRRANDPVRSFSRGLQQRVGIARVMLHDPSLILLDEPYTGLDAQAAETLNTIL